MNGDILFSTVPTGSDVLPAGNLVAAMGEGKLSGDRLSKRMARPG